MSAFRSWRWSALTIAFGLMAPEARAEMITPNSIPNPPTVVASPYGAVYANNFVNTQYASLGLNFNDETAITKLNGGSAWVPVGIAGGAPGAIDYAWTVGGNFVSPGSSNPTTVSSLSLDLIGNPSAPTLWVDGLNRQSLNIVPVLQSTPGPDGGQVWTFTGPGIASFGVMAPLGGPWGVSEVSFSPATAPEPTSLVLAGLGALGLAARFGWRRVRMLA